MTQAPPPNAAAQAELTQALLLLKQGNVSDAIDAFGRAAAADPSCAAVRSTQGRALLDMALRHRGSEHYLWIVRRAEEALLDALGLDWGDRAAAEGIQLVSSLLCVPTAKAAPDVDAIVQEADGHYAARRYEEARRGYAEAERREPNNWTAIKYLGNSYFALGQWAEAERHFRRAIECNPTDPQAYRFLTDALYEQKNYDGMWEAAYGAVAAHPRYWSGWLTLEKLLRPAGRTLSPFRLRPAVRLGPPPAPGQQRKLGVDPATPPGISVAWMVYAMQLITADNDPGLTPFQREHRALASMAKFIEESNAAGQNNAWPPELALLPAIAHHNDLDAAIFVLNYRDEYRNEFEAWKRAEAGASAGPVHRVKMFVIRSRLRPL